MKLMVKLFTLVAVALSLNSCGIVDALGRTAGRVLDGAADLTDQAMTTGL